MGTAPTHWGPAREGSAVRTSWTYDAAGQVTQLTHRRSTGVLIQSFAYQYDGAGNRTRLVEADGSIVTWLYDNAYQLKREERTGTTPYDENYNYDAAGNRTLSGGTTLLGWTYDAANQLGRIDNVSLGTISETLTYDQAGNTRSRRPTGGTPTTFTWDDENRLKNWFDNATRVTLTYNADGQRMALDRTPGGDFRWVWDQQNVLLETDDSGSTLEVDTHAPQTYGNLVSRRRLSGGTWFPRYALWDGIGSLDRETGSTETQEVNKYVYQAFGDIVSEQSVNVATNWRYVGRLGYYYDRITTALPLYVRARWLDTATGRFKSIDPLPGSHGTSLYDYTNNRPSILVDPSGLAPCMRRPCTVSSFDMRFQAAACGVFEPRDNGAPLNLQVWSQPFSVRARFANGLTFDSPDCSCCEYRQDIKACIHSALFRKNRATGEVVQIVPELPEEWVSDCDSEYHDDDYGRRSNPHVPFDLYTTTQMNGCTYCGYDSPGFANPLHTVKEKQEAYSSSDVWLMLKQETSVIGKIIDTCNGDRIVATRSLTLACPPQKITPSDVPKVLDILKCVAISW